MLEMTTDTALTVRAVAATDVGRVRSLNEDKLHALVRPSSHGDAAALLAVADGMGGHSAGEVASRLAVNTLVECLSWLIDAPDQDYEPIAQMLSPAFMEFSAEYIPQTELAWIEKHLCMAIAQANQSIYTYSQAHPTAAGNLGTTLTSALIIGNRMLTANIGDSRTYMIRDGIVTQLTEDHSFVNLLMSMGELTWEEAMAHPKRNLVTRSMGQNKEVEIDITLHELHAGDRILLCSDGFWEYAPDGWESYVGEPDLNKAVRTLIDLANTGGGRDNISVILADVTES